MYNFKFRNPTLEFMKVFEELFDEELDITSRKCPAHDVIENDDEFIVEVELAGIKKDDINIETEDNVLTIEAERKRDDKLKYTRKESYVGKYKRSFILPDYVDCDGVDATLDEGMLKITIPKTIDETKKKKQIVIN